MLLSEYGFVRRLGIWLCLLPIVLRFRSLPKLLKCQRLVLRRVQSKSPAEMDRAVRMTIRLCHLRVFRLPRFPRACLRQSMTLYRVLNRMGYPVQSHFGIHKDGDVLQGHSWVTLEGRPIAERTQTEAFKLVYSCPRIPIPDLDCRRLVALRS